MKTTFWTLLSLACGVMFLAALSGVVFDGLARGSILDTLIAGAVAAVFGYGARGAWRKAKGPGGAVTAPLLGDGTDARDERPWKRREQ